VCLTNRGGGRGSYTCISRPLSSSSARQGGAGQGKAGQGRAARADTPLDLLAIYRILEENRETCI